jgi:hypothetical protein
VRIADDGYVVHGRVTEHAARASPSTRSKGSSVLELHLAGTGRPLGPRTLEGVQEIMYRTSGSGTLAVAGESTS